MPVTKTMRKISIELHNVKQYNVRAIYIYIDIYTSTFLGSRGLCSAFLGPGLEAGVGGLGGLPLGLAGSFLTCPAGWAVRGF